MFKKIISVIITSAMIAASFAGCAGMPAGTGQVNETSQAEDEAAEAENEAADVAESEETEAMPEFFLTYVPYSVEAEYDDEDDESGKIVLSLIHDEIEIDPEDASMGAGIGALQDAIDDYVDDVIEERMDKDSSELLESGDKTPNGSSMQIMSTLDVRRADSGAFSIKEEYLVESGGANPNTAVYGYNFIPAGGEPVKFADVIGDEASFTEHSSELLKAKYGDEGWFDDDLKAKLLEIIKSGMNDGTAAWTMDETGVSLWFAEAMLRPASDGMISVCVPYEGNLCAETRQAFTDSLTSKTGIMITGSYEDVFFDAHESDAGKLSDGVAKAYSADIKKRIDDSLAEIVGYADEDERGSDAGFIPYGVDSSAEIVRAGGGIFSILETGVYDFGGVHPSTLTAGYNFDIESGERLVMEDVVLNGNELYKELAARLDNKYGDEGWLFENENETLEDALAVMMKAGDESTLDGTGCAWLCTNTGVKFFIPDSTLRPHADGILSVELPYQGYEEFYTDNFKAMPMTYGQRVQQ